MYDIARTQSQIPEIASFTATVRTYGAELSGLSRSDVHFVPFYTKSHMSWVLNAYAERVEIYEVSVYLFIVNHII